MAEPPAALSVEDADARVREVVAHYALGAALAMFAVPLPGADLAAVFAVWARMFVEIAAAHGETATLDDGRRLAALLVGGAARSSIAWWTSAKAASTVLRFVPFAGPVAAALVDGAVAARGVRRVTASVGLAASSYYRSGRTTSPRALREELARLLDDPRLLASLVGALRR